MGENIGNMELDPTYYGLHRTVKLRKLGQNHIAIVKIVKSRIIMKNAIDIVQKAGAIKEKNTALKVSLVCTANICSKSKAYLQKEGIEIIEEES